MTGSTDSLLDGMLEGLVLDDNYVANALLRRQYFPRVKEDGEELPPLFSSEKFTVEIAKNLISIKIHYAAWVELRTRRFDGLIRRLGIPHPVPYSRLILHIRDHWDALEKKLGSDQSQIKPEWYEDGRLIQMDYCDRSDEHLRYTHLAQGKQYLVKADISNCFPSVYSHALDWALRGKSHAKKWIQQNQKSQATSWEAELDTFARRCLNNETKGLLIGPAVSNLLAELVLQQIDRTLNSNSFVRYIDDYAAYFSTREEAEGFIVQLQRQLSDYRLDLNSRKTRIISLREGAGDAWMAETLSYLPGEWTDLGAARFLQQMELIAQRHPTESVLKFAAKTLLEHSQRPEEGSTFVVDELVRLTYFHPHLLPILSREIRRLEAFPAEFRSRVARLLGGQLVRAIRGAETDSILWLLFIIRRQLECELTVARETIDDMVKLNDDLVWLGLATLDWNQADFVERRMRIVEYSDEADRQAHWLARYEFWRVGRLTDNDITEQELSWMSVLKAGDVSFSEVLPF